jgi:hypothetical protein
MSKVALLVVGIIAGALFINGKYETPKAHDGETEIVMGHRIGSQGQVMLVTK